ncbi:MAG: sensor domain-containing protein [Segniliparus sp.]|uniref:sensor domain-containing protein n=1 Tax=Segniliparus sp. TaxID=2804064 RepID=UPI003F2F570C
MGRPSATSAAVLACAVLACALAGCGGADRPAPSATVRTAPAQAADSLLLGQAEISGIVGKPLTVRGEFRKPDDENSHSRPGYCEAVSGAGRSAALGTAWTAYHELAFDENVTEQSQREHYANGLGVDEAVVSYPEAASAAAAQRTVAEAARRCAGQTVVIDYDGVPQSQWELALVGLDPMSTSWESRQVNSTWTCSTISKRREAVLVHVMVCWSASTRDAAAKIMDRILEDRA